MLSKHRTIHNLLILLAIISRTLASDLWPVFYGERNLGGPDPEQAQATGTRIATGSKLYRVIVPPVTNNGFYQYKSTHYSGDYYIASTPDIMSWGAENINPAKNGRDGTHIRRVWIESIIDTECFASKVVSSDYVNSGAIEGLKTAKDQRNGYLFGLRNICVNCGVGGCERVDLSAKNGSATLATATNGSIFRHKSYRDWQGYAINDDDSTIDFSTQSTYRRDVVTTVSVIDRTNYFVTAGNLDRGLVRFDVSTNATSSNLAYTDIPAATATSSPNRTNSAVDMFIIRPTPFAVVTRIGLQHLMFNYQSMTSAQLFGFGGPTTESFYASSTAPNPRAGSLLGGYGDYIDWEPYYMYTCICPSYSSVIYCYTLRNGNNVRIGPNAATSGFGTFSGGTGTCRALVGIDESPFYAIAYGTKIEVHSILRLYDNTGNPPVDGDKTDIASLESGAFVPVAEYSELFDATAGNFPSSKSFNAGVNETLDDQIRDIVYINTHPYAAGKIPNYGATSHSFQTFHRKYNLREGPNENNEIPVSNRLLIKKVAQGTKILSPKCPAFATGDPTKDCFNKAQDGYWGSYQDFKRTQPFLVNPRERIFFVKHDYGKIFWWHEETPDGSGGEAPIAGPSTAGYNSYCHPFCRACRFPFNFRWCSDKDPSTPDEPLCRQRDDWPPSASNLANFKASISFDRAALTPPGASKPRSEFIIAGPKTQYSEFTDADKFPVFKPSVVRIPPECYPYGYPENDLFPHSHGFHNLWQAGYETTFMPLKASGDNTTVLKPWSTRPLLKNPPAADRLVDGIVGNEPTFFVPVYDSSKNGTYYQVPVRAPGPNWWKWLGAGLLGVLFFSVLGLGVFIQEPWRRMPVIRETTVVSEEQEVLLVQQNYDKDSRRGGKVRIHKLNNSRKRRVAVASPAAAAGVESRRNIGRNL